MPAAGGESRLPLGRSVGLSARPYGGFPRQGRARDRRARFVPAGIAIPGPGSYPRWPLAGNGRPDPAGNGFLPENRVPAGAAVPAEARGSVTRFRYRRARSAVLPLRSVTVTVTARQG